MSDTEIVALIKNALSDLRSGKISEIAFIIITASLIDPPETNDDDTAWANECISEMIAS